MSKQDKVGTMKCLRIPKSMFPFLKKNPKVAQAVGMGIITISNLQNNIEEVEKFLLSGELDYLLEDGSKEELQEFIEVALDSQKNGIFEAGEVSEDVLDALKEKLGDQIVTTTIDLTEEE
jgi:hypothetical protein